MIKFSIIINSTLSIPGVWNNVQGIDCWDKCGKASGKCDACSVDSSPAYCCHNNLAPDKIAENGDCPLEAVSSMSGGNGYLSKYHTCVRKTYPGKCKLSNICNKI